MDRVALKTIHAKTEPVLGFVPTTWEARNHCPELQPDEVHVWSADLNLDTWEIKTLRSLLSEREQARADRFKFEKHRRRYIASRGRLRQLLSNYSGIAAEDLRFRYGNKGKPSLSEKINGAELKFNSTDSDEKALFAFAWEHELGIDLECIPREVEHDDLAERYFAPEEAAALGEFPDDKRQEAFLACWTRKEAFGKIEGVGIRYPLDSVCLCENLSDPVFHVTATNSMAGRDWYLHQFYPGFAAVATLATSCLDVKTHYYHFRS